MLTSVWNSPIILGLLAALFYGFGSPIMKIGLAHGGVSPTAMMLAYGAGSIIIACFWWKFGEIPITTGNGLGITTMIAVGLLFGAAFVAVIRAFSLPMSSITIVITLTAAYPIIVSIIEVTFMEAKVRPVQALVGCVLVVAGVVLVATSTTKD